MDDTDEYGVSHQWQQQINSMITDVNARLAAAEARLGALEADLARELGALRGRLDRYGARLERRAARLEALERDEHVCSYPDDGTTHTHEVVHRSGRSG